MTCKDLALTSRRHGTTTERRCSGDALGVLPPHVYAMADQAQRMIVSETNNQSSAVSVEGRWTDTELLLSSSTTQLGGVLSPPVHTLGPTTPSTSSTNEPRCAATAPPALFTACLHLPFARTRMAVALACIDLHAPAHAPHLSDLRALLLCRGHFRTKAASPSVVPKQWQLRLTETGAFNFKKLSMSYLAARE